MGTCNIRSVYDFKSSTIPEVFYLDRQAPRVLHITGQSIKSTLLTSLVLYLNSAVFYLSESEFFVSGGLKPNNRFSKKVFRINTSLKACYRLPSLPVATTSGSLIIQKSSIYLIGAVMWKNTAIACPVLKLNFASENWEILDLNDLTINPKYSYSNILNPRACIVDSKVYLFGGLKLSTNSNTKKIFSLDLSSAIPKYSVEDFTLPEKFVKLVCCFSFNSFYICGEAAMVKERCLISKCEIYEKKWNEVSTIDGKMAEEYPPLVIGKKTVFFSYPYFVIQDREKITVINFLLDRVDISDHEKSPEAKSPMKSKRKLKKIKTAISAQYSKSTAPILPSNILKSGSFSSSSSSLYSSVSENSEISSNTED